MTVHARKWQFWHQTGRPAYHQSELAHDRIRPIGSKKVNLDQPVSWDHALEQLAVGHKQPSSLFVAEILEQSDRISAGSVHWSRYVPAKLAPSVDPFKRLTCAQDD